MSLPCKPSAVTPPPAAWDRRTFLKTGAQSALWMSALAAGLPLPRLVRAAAVPDLAVVVGDRRAATRAAVELLGGMQAFVKKGQKVVIKPNMSFSRGPEAACNTHPEVVLELVLMCREAGAARIRVLDNPLHREETAVEALRKACAPLDPEMVQSLTRQRFYRSAAIEDGVQMRENEVMQDVLEADVLIAAPQAKSHSSAGVSLSMKGMMGLVWNRWSMHSRFDLNESIVDLASLLKPHLVVIDASRVLSTNGPSGPGKVLQPETIIASRDMVAADAKAVAMFEWYGRRVPPEKVRHIRIAHERGLGRMDVERLATREVIL